MEELNYDEVHDYYENYNWQTGEQDIPSFTGEQLNERLEFTQVQEDLQNHLVYDHSYTDNINIGITILNLILVLYILYKQNTKSNG
jgi:hypothetical protein